jgi:t-SNARE complex subunit (syntaxin)
MSNFEESKPIDKDLSTGQLLIRQKDKLKEQDELLGEFEGLLKQSKQSNQQMSDEIDKQNPMLSTLDKEMDKVQNKIKRTQMRLNQYVQQSSNTCLMTTICLQIMLLLFIILVI